MMFDLIFISHRDAILSLNLLEAKLDLLNWKTVFQNEISAWPTGVDVAREQGNTE